MPATVLIVDDHPSFRATANALLTAGGFQVVGEAHNGASALRQIRALGPDVVLLDIRLPDIDGFEVLRRLDHRGDGPAVVLTSSRDATDFGTLIDEAGARGFIPKGELSVERLIELL